jgi:hypothetical protein
MKIVLWKERQVLGTNANINASSIYFTQIVWGYDFKQSISPYPQKIIFVAYDILGEDLW